MARGEPTEERLIAEFRAHYLYSGNASESAKAVGMPERTGRDIARKLSSDADFAEARRQLRAGALEELVAMRLRVAQKALDRFEGDLEAPEPIENGPPVTVIDKRADYGKLVLEAEKNAHNLAKFEAEKKGELGKPSEVHVIVKPTSSTDAKAASEADPEEENGD